MWIRWRIWCGKEWRARKRAWWTCSRACRRAPTLCWTAWTWSMLHLRNRQGSPNAPTGSTYGSVRYAIFKKSASMGSSVSIVQSASKKCATMAKLPSFAASAERTRASASMGSARRFVGNAEVQVCVSIKRSAPSAALAKEGLVATTGCRRPPVPPAWGPAFVPTGAARIAVLCASHLFDH